MSVSEGWRHCTKNQNGWLEELHHQYTFKGGEYCFSGEEHWEIFFLKGTNVACENIRFSSLFVAEDVSRGGTSVTQWQKFHTDDANQCLHNKSGSHGVPNINLSNFAWILVDFDKVLCWSAHELQQNSNASSREDCIPQILTVLFEILRVYIWPFWPFMFVCHS